MAFFRYALNSSSKLQRHVILINTPKVNLAFKGTKKNIKSKKKKFYKIKNPFLVQTTEKHIQTYITTGYVLETYKMNVADE